MKNYYAILGVKANATNDEIKVAYRQSAKRYHPDLNPGNENFKQRFLQVKNAYEILSNADARKKYDAELSSYRNAKQPHQPQFRPQPGVNGARPFQVHQHPAAGAHHPAAGAHHPAQGQQPGHVHSKHTAIIDEMKKMHELQLEFMRVSAKEEILKHKKQSQEQVKAFKKQAASELEKAKKQYKEACDKMAKEAKHFKAEHTKGAFNDGYKKGMKEAQNSAKKTIDELKKIIEQSSSDGDKKDGAVTGEKKLRKLKLELSLVSDKKRELEQQIDVLELDAKTVEEQDYKKIEELNRQLDDAVELIEELTKEREQLKKEIQDKNEETDALTEELLHLEGCLEMWREISSDNKITEDELDMVERYEGSQRTQAKDTLYGVLGVFLNALPEEIEAAYERLRKRYDGKDNYLDRYISIIEAYSILTDPDQKKAYDISISNETDLD